MSAQVDYWSTFSMDRWTTSAVKPINISLITTVTPDDGQKVYLFALTVSVEGTANDDNFSQQQTVYQVLPIAIYPSAE